MSHPATGRRLAFLAGGLILLLLLGFLVAHFIRSGRDHRLAQEALSQAAAPLPVELVTVRAAEASRPLLLPGEIAAWYESTLYARVNGYVGVWTADIGDHVKRGQVLASIETPELDAALAAAKANLRAAVAEASVSEAEAAFADSTYARWRDSPQGVVSEQERDDKKAQFESAKARLAAARAKIAVDQAELDRLNSFEGFKQVTAPYAGTITERRIDIGNLVTAGSSAQTTLLYRMAQVDPIRVFVDVPQSAAGDLMTPGAMVDVTAHDLSGRHFAGKISRSSEAIDPKSRTFRVEIDLPNPDFALLPGMYVETAFQLPSKNRLQIPASALQFHNDGPSVAIVDGAGRVHIAKVTIGRDDGSVIELSQGVAAGDRVVLNLSNQIGDHDVVAIRAIDGKAIEAAPESGR